MALTVKEANLNVPIMIFGCQETGRLSPADGAPRLLLRPALHRRRAAPDRRQVLGRPRAHLLPDRPVLRAGRRLVRRRLPRGQRRPQRPLRADRHPAGRLLDLPLQRARAAGAAGRHHRGDGPLRGDRRRSTAWPMATRKCRQVLAEHRRIHRHQRHSVRVHAAHRQVRSGHARFRRRRGARRPGHPVLDVAAGQPGHLRVHLHVPAGQRRASRAPARRTSSACSPCTR